MANDKASVIVVMSIGFLLAALLFPIAMEQVTNGTTGWTGWDTTVETIFTVLLPILVVIGIAIRFVPHGGT